MFTSKKSLMNAKWRRMWTLKNNMSIYVYKFFFLLSESTSQQEDYSFFFIWNSFNDCIGENMPSDIFMRIRSIFSDRQTSIKRNTHCSARLVKLPLTGGVIPKPSWSSLKIFFNDGGCFTQSWTEKQSPCASHSPW